MTRTTIIAADGTRFRPDTANRRLMRRGLLIALSCIGLIFLSAAIIGMGKAAGAPTRTHYSPSPASFAILHSAQKANPHMQCILEWNEEQGDHEVICN